MSAPDSVAVAAPVAVVIRKASSGVLLTWNVYEDRSRAEQMARDLRRHGLDALLASGVGLPTSRGSKVAESLLERGAP